MGRCAAELLLRQIEFGEENPVEKVFLQASLVIRHSTRRLGAELPVAAADGARKR
jgi:DNA-binding LacI/PurR family transcriptional regulator